MTVSCAGAIDWLFSHESGRANSTKFKIVTSMALLKSTLIIIVLAMSCLASRSSPLITKSHPPDEGGSKVALGWGPIENSENLCYLYIHNPIRQVYSGGVHFEGPHWSAKENALYWVDITVQRAFRLEEETGNVTFREFAYGPVSLVVTVKDYPKVVLLAVRSELFLFSWDSEPLVPGQTCPADNGLRLLSAVDVGLPDNRCNDGKADAKGRLWFGTIGKEVGEVLQKDQATLYMVDANNFAHPEDKVRPVSVSNGIAWTSDSKFMFYIDSPTRNIDVFDFNLDDATVRNRRTLFSFQANNVTGVPDGMTIDSDGNLWVACYNGGKVIKIDSRAGKLLEQHSIKVSKVTSVMWGGRDLSTLYVTTSKRGLTPTELAQQPEAGSLFAIEGTGSKGLPESQFYFPNADTY